MATAENVPEREKIRARFKLAIEQISPFNKLHARFVNNRLPAKSVMGDFLIEEGLNQEEVSECVETFLLNAKFVGVLQSVSGAERLLPLDYVLDYAPSGVVAPTPLTPPAPQVAVMTSAEVSPRVTDTPTTAGEQWDNIMSSTNLRCGMRRVYQRSR
jgi:hypothetical protein